MLIILTSSVNKFKDLEEALKPIETVHENFDLEEIQSLDPKRIIEHKLREAHLKNPGREFLLDDRSFFIEELNGLPGPFVKWFLESIGDVGIYRMTQNLKSRRAKACAWVGYVNQKGEFYYFQGEVSGVVVEPRGMLDYGWGPIFLPDGYKKTFGEMNREEKVKISHDGQAIRKFKEFYLSNGRV